ncbi:MAG: response regulator transcription factor [Luteolibacter sp.]
MHILVIEDEPQLARHVCSALHRSGHEVRAEHDGAMGLAAVLKDSPDLVVLDLNLPTMNGLEVLEKMRKAHSVARVIILTALGDVDHRIQGLKAGADDYIAKPFSMEELIARVEALGRRGATPTAEDILKVADLQMDVHQRRAARGARTIALSPREFELLQVLMEEPGRVFTRAELSDRVWQREHEYDTRTVEIFIARLRKKVDASYEIPLIHTIRSIGYTIKSSPETPP